MEKILSVISLSLCFLFIYSCEKKQNEKSFSESEIVNDSTFLKVATVTLDDGSVFAVHGKEVLSRIREKRDWYNRFPNYDISYFPLCYNRCIYIKLPIDSIATISRIRDKSGYNLPETRIVLVGGTEITGTPKDIKKNWGKYTTCELKGIEGYITAEGYPATVKVEWEKVAQINVLRDAQGNISATLRKTNDSVVSDIGNINFSIDGGSDYLNLENQSVLFYEVADVVLRVPVKDLRSITYNKRHSDSQKRWVVTLRNGRTLLGRIDKIHYLTGWISHLGMECYFQADFDDTKSILF